VAPAWQLEFGLRTAIRTHQSSSEAAEYPLAADQMAPIVDAKPIIRPMSFYVPLRKRSQSLPSFDRGPQPPDRLRATEGGMGGRAQTMGFETLETTANHRPNHESQNLPALRKLL
jgi:hypothetical protein